MTEVQLLNGMYACARKKTALNHQEQQLIRSAAEILERSLKQVRQQRSRIRELEERVEDLEERVAIMEEGAGLAEDDGESPWDEDDAEELKPCVQTLREPDPERRLLGGHVAHRRGE